jgi:recombination protein RecA
MFDIYLKTGIDKVGSIFEAGVKYGVIDKAGTWYSFGETKLGQGKEASIETLKADEALQTTIKELVLQKVQ